MTKPPTHLDANETEAIDRPDEPPLAREIRIDTVETTPADAAAFIVHQILPLP